MKNLIHSLRPALLVSYMIVFLAALGTFSSSKGCELAMNNSNSKVVTKTVAAPSPVVKKTQLRVMNPLQMISSKFF